MPKVSIVVPSFNHSQFLGQAIESVQAQSFQNWQMHVIDDCSTDDSMDVAGRYASSDPRVIVSLNPQNLGTYGTQARGLSVCEGEFVAVLNSDDYWHPLKLEMQVEFLEQHPEVPLCYVLGWKTDKHSRVSHDDDVHANWPKDQVQELFPWLLHENRVLASGVVFRRRDVRFEPSLRYSGDWLSLLRLAYRSPVGCVPERLTYWRMHESNSYVLSRPRLLEEIRFRRAILSQTKNCDLGRFDARLVSHELGQCKMDLIALYVLAGDMGDARGLALDLLTHSGGSRSHLRRAFGTFLSKDKVRRHLWGASGVDFLVYDDPQLIRDLQTLPPLDLDIP